jgi:hypothetical protein
MVKIGGFYGGQADHSLPLVIVSECNGAKKISGNQWCKFKALFRQFSN